MKIIEKNAPHKVKFEDISFGSLFKYQNCIYIALSSNDEIRFADINDTDSTLETEHFGVNLETGELVCFNYSDQVIPIDGTLIYERI